MATVAGIDKKIQRATFQTIQLESKIAHYTDRDPFTIRVDKEAVVDGHVGRLVAIKNPAVEEPDTSLVLLAGEILYQLRSSLDHLVHELVILSGNAEKLKDSRKHQFPIFESKSGYDKRAGRMTDGVSHNIAGLVEQQQPYVRRPGHPHDDALWILQNLNNTDKHRLIPVTVVGIDEIEVVSDARHGTLFTVQSPDIVLEHEKVLFTFKWPGPDENIDARISCSVAFQQAMSPFGVTLSMAGLLYSIIPRVGDVIDVFRSEF